jgi:hypothetical protein
MRNTAVIALLVWFLPALLLLVAILPVPLPAFYGLFLQIVVALAAAFIAYLLFTQRPAYYMVWGIVFVFLVLIYNPIVKIPVVSDFPLLLSIITALVFLSNWWLVFRTRYPVA